MDNNDPNFTNINRDHLYKGNKEEEEEEEEESLLSFNSLYHAEKERTLYRSDDYVENFLPIAVSFIENTETNLPMLSTTKLKVFENNYITESKEFDKIKQSSKDQELSSSIFIEKPFFFEMIIPKGEVINAYYLGRLSNAKEEKEFLISKNNKFEPKEMIFVKGSGNKYANKEEVLDLIKEYCGFLVKMHEDNPTNDKKLDAFKAAMSKSETERIVVRGELRVDINLYREHRKRISNIASEKQKLPKRKMSCH